MINWKLIIDNTQMLAAEYIHVQRGGCVLVRVCVHIHGLPVLVRNQSTPSGLELQ